MVFNEISLKQQVAKLPLTEQFSGFLKVCQELKHRNKDNDFYYKLLMNIRYMIG